MSKIKFIPALLVIVLLCAPVAAQEKKNNSHQDSRMNANAKEDKFPFACNLMALDAAQRQRHQEVAKQFRAAVQDVRELADGYAFRFPSETPTLLMVAEFVARERLCCPFFKFQIEVESAAAPLWLKITGREGVKEFLKSQFDK
ncbi:MAG TPA: hypothetical protein VNO70_19410 [Blastocatellia bacterium]|nr:hypothetical protein [Blastocatellia bacterium]